MPNAPHILETALLLLAAFLIGCVAGYALRRLMLMTGKPKSTAAQATAAPAATPVSQDQLVVAPTIAPIAAPEPKLTPAQRLAASAPEPATGSESVAAWEPTPAAAPEPLAEPVAESIQPARVAGQTTSGKIIPTPVGRPIAPDVAPEQPETVVVVSEVPPIDEAVHVLDPGQAPSPASEPEPPATTEGEPSAPQPSAPIEISWSELSGTPEAAFRSRLEAESEDAAMRAVEGGWTPRPAPLSPPRPVELLEPIETDEPAAPPAPADPEGASAAEIAGAISAARSAVEAASAAADAALAEFAEPAADLPEPAGTPATPVDEPGGDARGHAPFGRPAGLAGPRDGKKDELRQIKGLTAQAESALNALGIFHFDQIAAWDKKSALWIDNHLALKGSLARDKWTEQARELAKSRGPAFRAAARH